MIVDLNLAGKNVIVIGGGVEGVRKVKGLLGQNCKITVISERLNSYLEELAQQKKIEIVKMKIKNANILDNYQDIFLVLAATDNKELNRKIVEKGRSMMSFVYAADDPPVSDFSYASIINIEGIMQVAISTFGKSPIMARRLRIKAERILRRTIKQSDIENTKLQEFARMAARPKIKTVIERKRFLYSIIKDKTIQNLINENKIDEAKVVAIERLNHWSDLKK
ncbi:MAG TPA: bifunctional precorrin-2 dehydrogenase/sirohydrochlorin ferrochelatase [Nitrososphaeraceae archaeon]|nr:bifunctional precorrin-2 dehydrogenase/sirohydrochlorin ferrochelatase [Nitrososphaeraceae archaeon]HZB65597.1 bifunctional precorrin-2 dehydrogenase/sirohydrochlorin ferrochelatase [Nitrososphaeraceae archaeon]